MQIDGNSVIYAGAGVAIGIYWFITGFKELKSKRIIQNIPTSKINTGAVGTNVEIKARIIAETDKLVTAPISGRPCVLYSIEIQKWVRNRRHRGLSLGHSHRHGSGYHHGHWQTVDQFFSDKGFYVDDKSGANALVLVKGATIKRKGGTRDYELASNHFSEMHGPLYAAITENKKKLRRFKLKEKSWLFSDRFRFREWCFSAGEQLFVLGYADSALKARKQNKAKFQYFKKAKKMIQEDEELQKQFDSNRDGKLDFNELEQGAQVLARELQSKYSPKKLNALAAKTKMVFKNCKDHPFFISDMHEEELVKSIGWLAALKIWGGPALSVACAVYLITTLTPLLQ